MSDRHSTRSRFRLDPDVYLEHARAAIAQARGVATVEQSLAIARIRVRMHARANRHELGAWRLHPGPPPSEIVSCLNCGARGYLARDTGIETVAELLEACS